MRYLDSDWLAAFAAAVARSDVPTRDTTVTIEHRVTDGPEGDVVYQLQLRPDGATVETGVGDPPDVRLITDYATAAAIARGETSAQTAFLAGLLVADGDVRVLIDCAEALVAVDAETAALPSPEPS